ncbi:MAG: acetyl-CoA carboxylase biotin carboxyl carrier protein subunit [Bacteroidales bacterium]|nr:acetyl-CoA carboxylase biotin carboxyl carrier protein subunit [Bacteroidales bacterium]
MKEYENLGVLNIDASLYKTKISKKFESRKPYKAADKRLILSYIPGTVLDILVREGQEVKNGDELMILDAMKMQNKLKSVTNGRIKKIPVKKGDRVAKGTVLLELE